MAHSIENTNRELKLLLSELEGIRGRHTELITVYIPAGFGLQKVIEQIRNEQGTASNIKSKAVRKNVMSALEKVLQHMRLYKETPPNGLAVFCGNVSEDESRDELELWAVEPPEKINIRLYRCDQTFITDPLKMLIREREIYGIILMEASQATIGFLMGKRVELFKHFNSIVPNKFSAGGWSQARFARVRENLLNDFMKKIGGVASEKFMENKDLKGILIGGPGPTKDDFAKGDFLHYELKPKVLGIINTCYSGMPGLREVVEKSEDILKEASIVAERAVMQKFFMELKKDSGLAAYGYREVEDLLKKGAVQTLLLSESFDWIRAAMKCRCGFTEEKAMRKGAVEGRKCPRCGALLEFQEHLLLDDIIKLAESTGADVEDISIHTQEGEQLKELGGIAAILRYKQE